MHVLLGSKASEDPLRTNASTNMKRFPHDGIPDDVWDRPIKIF